ncbi:unnamed protein product, partial [marine sediment metagenome]
MLGSFRELGGNMSDDAIIQGRIIDISPGGDGHITRA